MKTLEFKKIIREEIRSTIREEIRDIIIEAVEIASRPDTKESTTEEESKVEEIKNKERKEEKKYSPNTNIDEILKQTAAGLDPNALKDIMQGSNQENNQLTEETLVDPRGGADLSKIPGLGKAKQIFEKASKMKTS